MQRIGRSRLWALLSCAVVSACVPEALVGDNSLIGVDAGVDSAPTIQGAIDDDVGPIRFDVEAERIVAPTWRYDFDCGGELCARAPDVRVAPDGSVWAALLGGYLALAPGQRGAVDTSSVVFAHLDESGNVLAKYSRSVMSGALSEWGTPLLLDQDGEPYLLRWPTLSNPPYPPARVLSLDGEQLVERPLPAAIAKQDTTFLAGFPDGSLLEFSMQNELRAVRYSALGERIWRVDDLRALPQRNASSSGSGGPIYLTDGSIVIDGLQKAGATGLSGSGLTVLGPDGKLRWDMHYFLSAAPYQRLAAGLDGDLLLAGLFGTDADLSIFAYDQRGNLLRSYRGARTGYHSVSPRALGVDENDAIYVAAIVGDRKQPRLSVCKLESAREHPARCVALDLLAAERSENAVVYPFLNLRMQVAAPNVLLLALAHLVGESVMTSIVRMDLDAPAAGAPAQ